MNEKTNSSFERALADLSPVELAKSSGMVMFEMGKSVGMAAGKAAGIETALEKANSQDQVQPGVQQQRLNRQLALWKLATVASLAFALFSLIGFVSVIKNPANNGIAKRNNSNILKNNEDALDDRGELVAVPTLSLIHI